MFGELFAYIWLVAGYFILTAFIILITGLLGQMRGRRTVPQSIGMVMLALPLVGYIILFFMGIDARPLLALGILFYILVPLIYLINIATLFWWKPGEWAQRNWKKNLKPSFIFFIVLLVIWVIGLILAFYNLPAA